MSSLLQGFLLASLFHLALFLGLRIASPANLDLFPLLVPVAVEIDLSSPHAVLPAPQIENHVPIVQTAPSFLEIPTTLPAFTSFPNFFEIDFSEIERIEYEFLEDLDD